MGEVVYNMDPASAGAAAPENADCANQPKDAPSGPVSGAAPVQIDLPMQEHPAAGPITAPALPDPGESPLANAKHEAFCEHVTGWGGSGDPVKAFEAYMTVYGVSNEATARVNASRLAARPDVQARCVWMRSQLANSILMDRSAMRAAILSKRWKIIEKTENTKDKDVALAAMRDVDKSMGLDGPDVSRTVQETSVTAAAVATVGQNIEAVAAKFAARSVVTTTTTKQ